MQGFSTSVRAYIFGVALAALALFASTVYLGGMAVIIEQPILFGLLLAAIVAASSYPVYFSPKTKVSVETTAIFAALLLLPPPAAMAISALGKLISYQVFLRKKWSLTLFEVAQTAFYTGLGSLFYHSLVSEPLALVINSPSGLLFLVGTAFIMHMVNGFLVAGVVALQTHRSPLYVWSIYNRYDLPQHVALYVMGPLTALLAQISHWTLCLMVIPVALIYISFKHSALLRLQTKDAVEALADTIDMRDPYTFQHSHRVARYARELAVNLGLPDDVVDTIESAARVHDLGKVGVSTSILNKPAVLSEIEWAMIREHPEIGASIVSRFPYYRSGQELIRYHHERYDGQGYPAGKRGDSIPIGARIIAVADAFDAMTSDRPYRRALPPRTVLQEFERYKGAQWDPKITDVLIGILRKELAGKKTPSFLPSLAGLPAS
jgi:hypothetical protein